MILHTPAAAPHLPKRSKESKLRCPFALCYVRDDGVAILVAQPFSHTRKSLINRARKLAITHVCALDRLYVWDTSDPVWNPTNPSRWTPIAATDKEQWIADRP